MLKAKLVGLAVIMACAASAAQAQNFVAIAIGDQPGVYGVANGMSTRGQAKRQSAAVCQANGGTGCEAVAWSKGQCAAVAEAGAAYDYGIGWADNAATTDEAGRAAISSCRRETGASSCNVVVAVCAE